MSQILLHNGGIGQTYDLCTPPPNQHVDLLSMNDHTLYYSALIKSEVTEVEGTLRCLATYKNGQPIKLTPFNYVTDPSSTNDVQFNFPSSQSSVRVKYCSTATGSTADKFDLTWIPSAPSNPPQNWPTDVATKLGGTAVVDPSVLAASNERGGAQEASNIGGTTSGSQVYASVTQRTVFVSGALAGVVAMVVGAWAALIDERC
ncbi:hypothetical protein FS837_002580 [Tulasnella sp. UAMH 9824]|nr:hypothetical protein FS837_002580 [Tulasnella sp. UAMH 9824]